MSYIYWLEAKHSMKHLSNHFILKVENKFMVFTSNPLMGAKSHLISNRNIEGAPKAQFLIEKVHTITPECKTFFFEKGMLFFTKNKENLQPFIQQLSE